MVQHMDREHGRDSGTESPSLPGMTARRVGTARGRRGRKTRRRLGGLAAAAFTLLTLVPGGASAQAPDVTPFTPPPSQPPAVQPAPAAGPVADADPAVPLNSYGDIAFHEAIGKGPHDPYRHKREPLNGQGGVLGYAGRTPSVPGQLSGSDYFISEDRWRISWPGWERYVNGLPTDPYHQNVLKGDYPICCTQDLFFTFTGIWDNLFEYRKVPFAKGDGTQDQRDFNDKLFLSFDVFKGDNSFHPADWFFRITPAFNIRDQSQADTTTDAAIQELFLDVQLGVVSRYYDTMDLRVGRQGFNADFRGFLFADVNDAVRLFGNLYENRYQYNIVFFDTVKKEAASQFNTFDDRQQVIFGANIIRQDPTPALLGLNLLAGVFWDHDDAGAGLDAVYIELAADGRIGKQWLVTAAFIQALGHDNDNFVSKRDETINAQFAAAELAYQVDWLFPKVSIMYASGDNNVADGQARGFDSIFDNPNFAGAGFGFVDRNNLFPGGIRLSNAFSFLPDMRTKADNPANFVNSGLLLLNTGFNAAVTTRLAAQVNFNYLTLLTTEPVEALANAKLKPGDKPIQVGQEIGFEANVGLFYKPFIVDNVIITLGASALTPGGAFKALDKDSSLLFNFFGAITLTY